MLRAHFDLIGSDLRSNPLFIRRFLSENRFTLLGKRSKLPKLLLIACFALCSTFGFTYAREKGSLKTMLITLTIDDVILTATIEDSPIGDDFISLLPMTLTLNDYASTEKVSNLPKRLTIEQAADGFTPVIGDIAYYAPWGNLAIFYQNFSYSKGLVKIGTIEGPIDALLKTGPFEVKIDKLKDSKQNN